MRRGHFKKGGGIFKLKIEFIIKAATHRLLLLMEPAVRMVLEFCSLSF